MSEKKKMAWGIEHVENEKTEFFFHPQRHTTPEEAKNAFAEHVGIPWKELARRGAKVVQQEIDVIPPK